MRAWFCILAIVTAMLKPIGYRIEPCEVTAVERGVVTMTGLDGDYWIAEDEAWQVGDRALALVRRGKIVEVRYVWE